MKPSERIEEIREQELSKYNGRKEQGSWPELDIWAIKKYLDEEWQKKHDAGTIDI